MRGRAVARAVGVSVLATVDHPAWRPWLDAVADTLTTAGLDAAIAILRDDAGWLGRAVGLAPTGLTAVARALPRRHSDRVVIAGQWAEALGGLADALDAARGAINVSEIAQLIMHGDFGTSADGAARRLVQSRKERLDLRHDWRSATGS